MIIPKTGSTRTPFSICQINCVFVFTWNCKRMFLQTNHFGRHVFSRHCSQDSSLELLFGNAQRAIRQHSFVAVASADDLNAENNFSILSSLPVDHPLHNHLSPVVFMICQFHHSLMLLTDL